MPLDTGKTPAHRAADRLRGQSGAPAQGGGGRFAAKQEEGVSNDYSDRMEYLAGMDPQSLAEMIVKIAGDYMAPDELDSMIEEYSPVEMEGGMGEGGGEAAPEGGGEEEARMPA